MDTMAAMWDGTQSRPIVQPHEGVLGSLTIEEIHYTAPDGVPVLGFLCEDSAWTPREEGGAPEQVSGHHRPLLVHAHGGPAVSFLNHRRACTDNVRYPYRHLLKAGYRVFCPLFRGTMGFGGQWCNQGVCMWLVVVAVLVMVVLSRYVYVYVCVCVINAFSALWCVNIIPFPRTLSFSLLSCLSHPLRPPLAPPSPKTSLRRVTSAAKATWTATSVMSSPVWIILWAYHMNRPVQMSIASDACIRRQRWVYLGEATVDT